MNYTEKKLKTELVEIARAMSDRGLVGTYEGNLSVRDVDRMYLTPTAHSKENLRVEDVVTTNMEGKVISGTGEPTSETPMHSLCYKLREDVSAVVHCHAVYSTAFAGLGYDVVLKDCPEFLKLFGRVPLLKFGTPGTIMVIADLHKYEEYDMFLLENHGVLALGANLHEAYSKTLSLEMMLHTEAVKRLLRG